MKRLIVLFIIISSSLNAGIYEKAIPDYKVDHQQEHVLEIAKSLPQEGILRKKPNGYVYLDVTNAYITKIFPNLILDGHLRPTESFGSEEGAHITVVVDTEKSTGIESEIGKKFTFTITELRTIPSWKTTGSYQQFRHHTGDRWVIAVESQALEELRVRCGLRPLVSGHDFHITIGFEVPFDRINNYACE